MWNAGTSGLSDRGLRKLVAVAFAGPEGGQKARLKRSHDGSAVGGEAFFRGQDSAIRRVVRELSATPSAPGKVLIVHRSWDDATLKMYVDSNLINRAQELIGLPAAFMKWKHNTVGVCIMNQRRAIRWGSGDGDFSEVVLPARIMTSNSAASLFASLDTVVPALQLEELKKGF